MLQDEINTLRKQGASDDEIIKAYQSYNPSVSDDIDGLLKKGAAPDKIVDALGAYDAQSVAQADGNRSAFGSLRYGTAQALQGEAATARETLGDGLVSSTLDKAANFVKPDGYKPAADSMGKGTTWWQWLKALPSRVVESAPGISQDLAAGAAGAEVGALGGPFAELTSPLGGIIGFGSSYLSRNYGSDAEANAAARTGQQGVTPDDGDKARALAQGVAGAALSRVGLGAAAGSAVKAAGEGLVKDIVGQAAKGAASDAATSAASDAIHQGLTPNATFDPNDTLDAAATGAVAGAGLRGVHGVGDVATAARFKDLDTQVAQRLGSRLAQEDTSSPSASFQAVSGVDRDLRTEVSQFAKDAAPQIQALQKAGGFQDDTGLLLAKARADIAAGQPADADILSTLQDRLGTHHEGQNLVDALAEHSALQQLKAAGNFDSKAQTFGGGLSGSPIAQRFVKPGGVGSMVEDAAAGLAPMLPGHGFSPAISAKMVGAQAGLYGALKGIDALTGAGNPADAFTGRFADADGSASPGIAQANADLPSFREQQSQAQARAQRQADFIRGQQAMARRQTQTPQAPQANASTEQPATTTKETTGPVPVNDNTASAVQAVRMMMKAMGQPKEAQGAQATPKPQKAAQDAHSELGLGNGSQKAGTAASESLKPAVAKRTAKGEDYHHHEDSGDIIVSHKDHTIVRSAQGVRDVGSYASKIHQNLRARDEAFASVKRMVDNPDDRSALNTLHHRWNQRSATWADAYDKMEDVVNDLHVSDKTRGHIMGALSSDKVRATWNE